MSGKSKGSDDFGDWLEPMPESEGDEDTGDPEEIDDLGLAITLLVGKHDRDKNGQIKKRYLEGDDEFVGRKAIVRLLRSPKPLDPAIRRQLAALFDPQTETAPFSSPDSAPMERRLVFTGRHRGGAKNENLRKLEIGTAYFGLMQEAPRKSRDDAIHEISGKYSVSTRTVETAVAYVRDIRNKR